MSSHVVPLLSAEGFVLAWPGRGRSWHSAPVSSSVAWRGQPLFASYIFHFINALCALLLSDTFLLINLTTNPLTFHLRCIGQQIPRAATFHWPLELETKESKVGLCMCFPGILIMGFEEDYLLFAVQKLKTCKTSKLSNSHTAKLKMSTLRILKRTQQVTIVIVKPWDLSLDLQTLDS